METKRICPSCRKTLPPHVPLGLCPECLMKAGFNTGTEPGGPGGKTHFVPPSVAELAPHFPQLEILGLIGQGGMGAVYKARQRQLDRLVALKILPPGAANDAGFAERFNREARALARLNHPHIVAVHDFGQANGQPYLVMEFVEGPNLRQIEQAGRLAPEQALKIVPQICEALQFAHGEGIVHRDIKPENILLDKKGRVKITDFGIAKILDVAAGKVSLTGAKDVVGTPHYMAPEQVEHPQTVDHRADIFSLGVVFYELLTGELPLGKFQPPSKKVQVDVRLDEVVLHALEKEPERRYQHASEVKTDVETIAHTPSNPPPTHAGVVPPSAPKPNAWEAALIGIGLTVFIALLVALPTVSASVRPVLAVVIVVGLIICLLTLAGWWPAPSFLIPDSGFAGRNLPSRRRAAMGLPAEVMPDSSITSVENERIRRAVRGPAIGLLVTGILNWILIPIAMAVIRWIVPLEWKGPALHLSNNAINGVFIASLVLCSFIIYASLKMMRLEARGMAAVASLAAILVTPGNLIGLPLGVWSLATLARGDVKGAFRKTRREGWDVATWGAFIALGVLGAYAIQIGGRLIGVMEATNTTRQPAAEVRTADPTAIISEKIREKVGHDLREIGASYDELQVVMAGERRDWTEFKVSYRGLRGFRWNTGDAATADGEFLMRYIGGGQWRGALGEVQFTVTAARTDDFTLPFVNDPPVLGDWVSVDFVASPEVFDPDKKSWRDSLYLTELSFREGGRTGQPWWTWTKGMVFHQSDKTASHYEIREIKGQSFLFFEWKSGDVMIAGEKPWYYVLKKKT